MRKINKANKRSFGIFGAIILLALVGLCAVMVISIRNSGDVYATENGYVVYDKNIELIDTNSDGEISRMWNKEYYLSLKGGDKYSLGEHNVVFNPRNRDVKVYGNGYKVLINGSVENIGKETIIKDTGINYNLYKLADRRYLMTGGDIYCTEQNFTTRTYLEIFIDKSGCAHLVNNVVNMKTTVPMILRTGDIVFDIANEKMKIGEGDKEIDLKAIGGSTNEYSGDKDAKSDANSSSSSSSSSSGGQVIVNGGGGSGSGSGSGSGGESKTTPANLERSITLRGTKADVTSIDVDYRISDVENNYIRCYLKVKESSSEEEGKVVELNKADTEIQLRDLKPDTQYEVSLWYDTWIKVGQKSEIKENVQNVVTVKTLPISCDINVTRLTKRYMTVTVRTDSEYILDSAQLVLYGDDGKEYIREDVNIAESINGGWTTKLNIAVYAENTEKYTLRLENGVYEGESVKLRADYSFKNSLLGFLLSKLTY